MLKRGFYLAVGFLTSVSGVVTAQNAKIEGDFIFFVDGVNIKVPTLNGGAVVNDPANVANKLVKFNNGSWAATGFQWPIETGVDISGFTGDNYGETDTLFLKLNVDPANTNGGLRLEFFDKSNGGILGTSDLSFRMGWTIPPWAKDGNWHNLAIPLPPRTSARLDSAKKGKKFDGSDLGVAVDTLFKYWAYGGAWGNGAGVWGPTEPNWAEWQWDGLYQVGFHFDWDGASGPIYVDDFYIGGKKTDLTVATRAPQAVPAVEIAATGKSNSITWTNSPDGSAYQVYYSDKAFTSISDPGVSSVGRFVTGPVVHTPLAPHPNLAKNATSYYAVTSVSDFGKENGEIANSYKSVVGNIESTPWMQEVSESVAEGILEDLDAKLVTNARFPADLAPFVIEHTKRVTEGSAPSDAADLSAKTWAVYFEGEATGTFIILYSEVTDQYRQWTTSTELSTTWNFDSIELAFGGYPVTSFTQGSTHTTMMRGAEPDYQFRLGKFSDRAEGFVYENFRFATIAPNAACLVDSLKDNSGNVIGYKILAALNIEALQGGTGSDALIDLPNGENMKLFPFNMSINDADGNSRESQVTWSYKPNVTNAWWNQPGQWPAVAFAGKDVVVNTSSEEQSAGRIGKMELFQNYPNPFNPSTSIKFNIPAASDVRLEVFNVLGQKVATLVDGRMTAGTHKVTFDASAMSSGLYLYRLTAGGQQISRKLSLVK
jgi:hypothetical protein